MGDIHLTVAISDYDHVRDFIVGRVKAEGIEITALNLVHEEIFYRFLKYQEWDVSEISFAKYCALASYGDNSMKAIPVFPSRAFRLSSFYVHREGGIKKPNDLAGKKVGIPEWAQTASVYTRGYLMHQIGIPLTEIDWYQAGVNEPGRAEKVNLKLPEGVRYTPVTDRSLSEMLLSRELDAVLSARPPQPFVDGHPDIVRLFPDFQKAEEDYFRQTGIFPIMHVIVIRTEVLEHYPWVAMNLFKAFEEAKNRSLKRALDFSASRFPIPWASEYASRAAKLLGKDFWPYGIEPNRTTLSCFLQYAYEQGVCHRLMTPEELFPKTVQSSYVI